MGCYKKHALYAAIFSAARRFWTAWVLDLSAGYTLKNRTFTFGGDNATDKYPENVNAYASSGGNLA